MLFIMETEKEENGVWWMRIGGDWEWNELLERRRAGREMMT